MQTATVAQGRSISDQIGSNHTRRARSARRALLLAAAAVTVGSVAQSSHATSYNWDPGHVAATTGGGTGTWDTASSNWFNSTDQVWPNTNPNTDNAIFGNAATAATVTIQGASAAALNVFANQVTFSSANYTLTGSAGSTLTLSGTAPAISTSGGTAAISVPIVLGANANFTTTNTLTLNSGAVISGNFGITHVGPGFLTLVSNSSFSGGINNISGSIGLQIAPTTSTASAIGSGTFTSAGGVSMNNNLTSTAIQLINNLQSYSAATNVLFSAGSTPYLNMGTGAATLTGNTTFSVRFGSVGSGQTPGGTFVIGGNVGETGGSFGITMGSPATVNSVANVIAGTGTLVLSGNNTFSGPINLNVGALNFANINNLGTGTAINFGGGTLRYLTGNTADISGRTVTLNNGTVDGSSHVLSAGGATIDTYGNDVSFANGLVAGTGSGAAGGLTKAGAGTLTLNGVNTYTGTTTVSGGSLAVGATGSIAASTGLSIGATLSFDPSSAGANFTNGTTLTGGAQINAAFSNASSVALGAITRTAGTAVNINLPTGSGTVSTSTANTGGTILGGWATVNGTDWANNNGTNIAPFGSYSSTYSNGADVDSPNNATPTSISINSLRFNTAGATTIADSGGGADTLTVATGGILDTTNAGAVSINVGNLASSGELIVNQHNTNAALTIASNIGGSQTLTKAGAGVLVLSGTNGFSGGLNVVGGRVDYGAVGALGSSSNAIKINGGTLRYTGTTAVTQTQVMTIGAGGATLDSAHSMGAANAAKITMSGDNQITGSGTITVTGGQLISLNPVSGTGHNGNNTFTGQGAAWMINDGFLETSTNALAAGALTVPITINSGGEWANKGQTDGHNVTLNGGAISNDSGTTDTFGGQVTVTAASKIRLGDFFDGTNRNLQISGPIQGSANLSIINANAGAPTDANHLGTPGNPSGQVLILSGNNMNYTGTLDANTGHYVRFVNPISVLPSSQFAFRSTSNSLAGITIGYNNGTVPAFSEDPSSTNDGVFGTQLNNTSENFNMSTIGNGNWYFGTDVGGVSYFGVLTPGNGGTFRLTGGTAGTLATGAGGLFVGSGNTLAASGTHSVIIGDTRIGGTGVVRFGAAQMYAGNTTVNAGSALALDFSVPAVNFINLYPTGSALTLAGGTLVTIGKASSNNTQAVAGVTISPGGNSAIIDNVNATSSNLALTLNGISRNTGGTVDFTLNAGTQTLGANGISTTTANSNFTGSNPSILGGYATVGGNTWAVSAGDGTNAGLVSGLATYSTSYAANADIDVQAGSNAPGTLLVNSMRFNAAGGATVADAATDTLTVASGGILETSAVGNNPVAISVANLLSGNGQDLVVINNNTAANPAMTIDSLIADNGGSNGLTKSGPGGLILTAANTFTGNTSINGGAVTLANSLALQNSTVFFTLQGGTLNFGTLTSATLGGLSGNQNLSLSNTTPAAVALTVGGNNQSTTYAGVMSGLGSVTKVGSGTLTLSGANTYAGTTTISAGTLQVGDGKGVGSLGSASVTDNGTLAFNRGDNANVIANTISGTGSVAQVGTGKTTLTGTNSYSGGTAINAGALNAAAANLGTGAISFDGGGTLQFAAAFDPSANGPVVLNAGGGAMDTNGSIVTVAGAINGTGGLTKVGAGSLALNGVNGYAGNTNVNAGSLTLGSAGSLASANITVAPTASAVINGQLAATATVNANGPTSFGGTTGNTAVHYAFGTLNVAAGLTVPITASSAPFTPAFLEPATLNFGDANSKIDISNNALVTGGNAAAALALIQSGQVFTSIALDPNHALAYVDVPSSKMEIRYTLKGDANADGQVNVGDLGALATSYGITGGMSWGNGDFNQDGTVNVADLGALATNYNLQVTGGGSSAAAAQPAALIASPAAAVSSAAVPEPTTLGLMAIGAVGLISRRKRR